jgi:hypothetical protein
MKCSQEIKEIPPVVLGRKNYIIKERKTGVRCIDASN